MIERVHANGGPTLGETISGQAINARTLLDDKIDLVLTSGERPSLERLGMYSA